MFFVANHLTAPEINSYGIGTGVTSGVGDGCRLDLGTVLVGEKYMGAAKRRAVARAGLDVEVDIPRLAAAMRKYALAASDRLGSDGYIHAAIVREILTQIGFDPYEGGAA